MVKQKRMVYVVIAMCLIGGIGYGVRLQKENNSLKKELTQLKQDPQSINREEVKKLVEIVSKLVVLPTEEEPVVATVTDKEKLKDQPVFAKTENDDKILIYSNAKKAYVYRPSKNMIVDVIPVNIGDQTPVVAGVSTDKPVRLALVNGTKTANMAGTLEQRIKDQKIAGISVVSKATAKVDSYKRTQLVDLTGKMSTQVKSLASLIDGDVATDTAEAKPTNADILVIIGENFK